ncbi:MAG TPA: hypothetical protein VMF89_32455 [Polyangiales bacterium]|nr:hypothetical protein [Polyangiales bacterium]
MHRSERSRNAALDQTWPDGVGGAPTLMPVSSVSTLRVKLIGGNTDAHEPLLEGKTRRYPSALPDPSGIEVDNPADDNEYWHDVSGLMETADRSYQPIAYAHTLPAISLEDLELEDSGVREIRRLQLWLHPRDSVVPSLEQRDGAPTLRVSAAERGQLERAWQAWEQQSPGMTIFTATVLCVISALAVSLFAH